MKYFTIISLVFIFSIQMKAQLIWSEDFNSYAAGTGIDGTGNIGDYPANVSKWTLDVSGATLNNSGDYFKTVNGQMEGSDLDGPAIWTSESINISSYSLINISIDASEDGSLEAIEDFIRVSYKLDNGSEIQFGYAEDDFTSTTFTLNNLDVSSNSTLNIIVEMSMDQGNEYVRFDNVLVDNNIRPEPANHATSFSASENGYDKIDLSWTDASGGQLPTGYVIKANTTGIFTDPIDTKDPNEDTDLSDGEALIKISYGDNSYSFSNLVSSTKYYFKIWPYTNTGSDIDFKTNGTVPTDDETTLIKNVYVNKNNNCVTINEIEYEVLDPSETTKYVQTSSGSGSNPTPTNVAVNILRISIDESTDDFFPDNTTPALSNFNSKVGNPSVTSASQISVITPTTVIEHHDGSNTNTPAIDNPAYFSSLANVVGIADMRSYFNLSGNVLNNSEGFMDVLYDDPIIEGDIVFVSERDGNVSQSFTPLDINGNPIPGAVKVTIGNATSPNLYQWNTTIESSADPNGGQPQWVIGFCAGLFYDGDPNIGPVYGWRVDDLGVGGDGKILLFRKDSDLSLSKTVDDSEPSVGNNITFTINVSNNGPANASGVEVKDQLPEGLIYVSDNGNGSYNSTTGIWSIGDLANGNSTSLTITATVTEDALPDVTNTACINYSEQFDSNENNNCDDAFISPDNEDSNPLPIELLSFDAKANNNKVNINWTTASELNNNYFEVQKSNDGLNFKTIKVIDGAGNSNKTINYHAVDNNPISGISYYKLKQTDFDGSFSLSEIKAVNFSQEINIKIFPNPASEILNIQSNSTGIIEIRNQNGSLVYKAEIKDSNSKINISQIASGVYMLKFISNDNIEVKMFIKR